MRHGSKNTFIKGMNQDKSLTLVNNSEYKEARNARLTTDESGESTGSLTSIKGTKLDFNIPNVGDSWKITIQDTFIDANLDGTSRLFRLTIRGVLRDIPYATTEVGSFYTIISEYINSGAYGQTVSVVSQANNNGIVLYTEDFSSLTEITTTAAGVNIRLESPGGTNLEVVGSVSLRDSTILFTCPAVSNGSGQIWEVTWDDADVPFLRLVRNVDDNFSLEYPIEAVSRYETKNIRRVVFTDFNSAIKSLNIDSNTAYLDQISIIPAVEFDVPKPTDILQAQGTLETGVYSTAYRLKTLGGSETSFSGFSVPVSVHEDNEDTESYEEYTGSESGIVTSKALEFVIDNIDTSFSNIDIIVARLNTNGIADYYLLQDSFSLTGASSYRFVLDSITEETKVDEAEILLQPAAFFTAKSLTVKDNRLLAANVKDIDLSLEDWDSHTVRYNSNSGTDGYETTTNKVNKYNKDSTRSTLSADQQKFKADGVTLGGEGDNVSYEFITKEITLDNFGGNTIVQNPNNSQRRYFTSKDVANETLNGEVINLDKGFTSYKNPLIDAHFRGHMRSEVYRFGIVFFDLKGRPSAVKWIGDIRMPEAGEMPTFNMTDTELKGNVLGLRFNVQITDSIRSKFTGFSIVRAERPVEDSTILGQGLVGDTTIIATSSDGSASAFPEDVPSGQFSMFLRTDRLTSYGDQVNPTYKCVDVPEWKFLGQPAIDGGYLRPVAAITPSRRAYMTQDDGTGQARGTYARYYQVGLGNWFLDNSNTDNIKTLSPEIEDSLYIPYSDVPGNGDHAPVGASGPRTDDIFKLGSIEGFFNFMAIDDAGPMTNEASFGSNSITFRTRGTSTAVIKLKDSANDTYMVNSRVLPEGVLQSGGTWIGGPSPRDTANIEQTVAQSDTYGRKLLANIYRELPNQYGGDSKSAIDSTEYISTGQYQSFKAQDSSNVYTVDVFGGDTYINTYDETIGMAHHGSGVNWQYIPDAGKDKMTSLFFPVESRINIDLRKDRHFSIIGNSTTGGTNNNVITSLFPNDVFDISGIDFTGQNNIKFKSLTSFRNNASEFDNRIYASDAKVNGEPGDAWTSFKPLNFIDVDGNHGPINKILTFNDTVMYFQDNAYGRVAVNPRVQVQGADDIAIELGVGGILHDFTYNSTTIGSKHQWSIFQSPYGVYWFNVLDKKTYKFGGRGTEELVDMKGMHSFYTSNIDQTLLTQDNPLMSKGVHGTYDYLNKEPLFTFLGQHSTKDNFTIAYSEAVGAWTSFMDFLPKHYVNSRTRLLSANPLDNNSLYRHNIGEYLNFYGEYKDFKLKIVVNPAPDRTKMFENISLHTNVRNEGGYSLDQKTFEKLSCYTDYQHSGEIILNPGINIKRKEREWNLLVPRNVMVSSGANLDIFNPANYDLTREFKDKLRDKYMIQEYSSLGQEDADQFIVNYINTYFRVSAR